MTDQVAAISKVVGTLSSHVEAMAGAFDKVTGGLVPSVVSFCDAIDHRFSPAVTQQSAQAELVGRSMQRLLERAGHVAPPRIRVRRCLAEAVGGVGAWRRVAARVEFRSAMTGPLTSTPDL